MKKKLTIFLCAFLVLTSLTGCKVSKLKIAYTAYPVGYIINRLAQDRVDTVSLQDNTIIQRAQINSTYKEDIKDADLIVHIGQLEPYLSLYLKDIRNSKIEMIDLSSKNSIYDFQRYTTEMVSGSEVVAQTDYYIGDAFKTIDKNEKDLFLWMDPIAMTSMAKEIRDWLIKNYAEDKVFFEENYKALESDLVRLDAEYQTLKLDKLVPKFVSMTASFGNWQKAYGVQVYPVILSKFGVLPTPEQLAIIKERVLKDGVKTMVVEPNMTEDMRSLCANIAKEWDLTTVELSNLSSLTQGQIDSNKDYLTIMYENLAVLETIAIQNLPASAPEK